MGNNAAFTAFEATVIAVYNKGVLDLELLSTFMEQYRDVDIDHGGMEGTLSNDGLDVEEIVFKTFGVKIPPRPKLPTDYLTWTPAQHIENDAYWEKRHKEFKKISCGKFGWE
jgi:hypothetical protein